MNVGDVVHQPEPGIVLEIEDEDEGSYATILILNNEIGYLGDTVFQSGTGDVYGYIISGRTERVPVETLA